MLSIDRCRKLIKAEAELSDEGIEEIRNSIYGLANVIVAVFPKQAHAGKLKRREKFGFADFLETLPPNEQDELDERAAIVQDGNNCSQDEAERAAITRYIEKKKN